MSIMCEECKCSIFDNDSGCDSGCGCCNREDINELLATRTAQLLAITEDDRDEYSDENPIFHAEQGPNRFYTLSMFFTDNDGVRIEEDLSFNDITVTYFTDETSQELTEGALYEWAINYYKENN